MADKVRYASVCTSGIVYTTRDGKAWHADREGNTRELCPGQRRWDAVACSSNGVAVLVDGENAIVRAHNMHTGANTDLFVLKPPEDPVVAVSGDGTQFAISSAGSAVGIWDIAARQLVCIIKGVYPSRLRWNPERPLLLVDGLVDEDGYISGRRVYDTRTGAVAHRLSDIWTYEWSTDGAWIATRAWAQATMEKVDSRDRIETFGGHGLGAGHVLCPPRPDLFAYCTTGRKIHVWARRLWWEEAAIVPAPHREICAMTWGEDPDTLLCIADNGKAHIVCYGVRRSRRVSGHNPVPMVDNPEALLRGRKRPRVDPPAA